MNASVAVIGLPGLADDLRRAGFEVVGQGDFRADATVIRERLDQGHNLPVLVSDERQPGLVSWVGRMRQLTTVVLVPSEADATIEVPGVRTLGANPTVAEVCESLGLPHPSGRSLADFAPTVTERSDVDDDPWGDGPVLVAPAVPVDATDGWDDDDTGTSGTTTTGVVETNPVPNEPSEPAYREVLTGPVDVNDANDPWYSPDPGTPVFRPPVTAGDAPKVEHTHPSEELDPWDQPAPTVNHPPVTAGDAPKVEHTHPSEELDPWDQPAPTVNHPPVTDTAAENVPTFPVPRLNPFNQPEPAPVTPPTEPHPDPVSVTDRVFEPAPETRANPFPVTHRDQSLAPVLFVIAAKGGVGKSTIAANIAQRAAEVGRQRVVLIDANRGQGDQRRYLRLQGDLPTVYDTARTGDPTISLLSPARLTEARHPRLQQLHFGLVLAPSLDDQADPRVTPAAAYQAVIDHARTVADLVVVDTQIIERFDTSGLIDGLVTPSIAADGWALAVSDLSSASIDNLHERATAFQAAGVSPSKMLMLINRVDPRASYDPQALRSVFAPLTTYLGAVSHDTDLANGMQVGRLDHHLPSLSGLLDDALWRVTGLEVFNPANRPEPVRRRRFKFPLRSRT